MSNKIFKLFFFLGFFISNIILSQTNRFIYEVDFKLDSLQREPYTETFVLDINPKDVKFYNYNLLETDSLNKRFNDDSVLTLPTGLFTIVKHQLNKNEFTNFAFVGMDYYQFNSVDKIVWKLSNETKMYENYKLQKAEAIFGKRKWTAWFCKEIPINEGPYKFRGLPGLIFIVEDSAKNYKFTLKKNIKLDYVANTNSIIESNFGKKPITVYFKKYIELAINQYNNLYSENLKLKEGEWSITSGNQIINSKSQLKKFIEIEQENIKRKNNPIDKNYIIPY